MHDASHNPLSAAETLALLQEELQAAESCRMELRQKRELVEAQWQALSVERERWQPLEDACVSIERLFELNLANEFWGGRATDTEVRTHLADVRANLGSAGERLAASAEQRRHIEQEIDAVQLEIFDLEDAILESEDQLHRKHSEWLVEREASNPPPRIAIMPWNRAQPEDARFRRSLLGSVCAALFLGAIIPMIELPLPEPEAQPEEPDRLARLIRRQPVRPLPEPELEPRPQIVERPPEPPKPVEPKQPEMSAAPTEKVAAAPAPEQPPETPRKDVASEGLLAFRERFSSMAASRPATRSGADVQIKQEGTLESGLPERAMIATAGPGSSGGINLAALSRDVGAGAGAQDQITGAALTKVASRIGGSGSSGRPRSSAAAGRTDEEIQIVFDRYKAALYRLYNKALRIDPGLRGQIVLRLTIEPDGTVSLCQLQSSDMNAPELSEQIVDRVSAFDFGAKAVPAMTILYPIDFLPTA